MEPHKRKLKIMRKFRNPNQESKPIYTDYEEIDKHLTMLNAMEGLVSMAEETGLNKTFFDKAKKYIDYIVDKQNINATQAVMLALIMEKSYGDRRVEMSDLALFLECRNIKIIQYQVDVNELVKMGMVIYCSSGYDEGYIIAPEALKAFKNDEAFKKKSLAAKTATEFFQHVYDLTHQVHEDRMSTELFVAEFERLLNENPALPYVQSLEESECSFWDKIVLSHLSRHLVLGGNEEIPLDHIGFLEDDPHKKFDLCMAFKTGKHHLMKIGLIEHGFESGFENEESVRLTDKAKNTLLAGVTLNLKNNIMKDVVRCADISPKDLFFSSNVQTQLNSLYSLLEKERYQDICKRLEQKGMRKGFTCLFYGVPGTGKTESVLQLARRTGRDVMQVNVSDIKSKWVGESEKNIKALFDQYRNVAKTARLTPILLFNEADAIIGKRKEGAEHAVDKMENSIQNIILQEMEKLEGIMIATTNLVQNMDNAFERRFLYKVRFEKPDTEQRSRIWQSMLPKLSEKLVYKLANTYDFSGGQIENIARKCDIESILYGDDYLTDSRLEEYCRQETICQKGSGRRIGFIQ